MAKKAPVKKNSRAPKKATFKNDYAQAMGLGTGGFPFTPTSTGDQLSQGDSLYDALRWYQLSNYRQLLSEAYVEIGLVKTICNVPVDDAFRGGVEIETDQLDPEDVHDLQVDMEKDGDLEIAAQARKWVRLFGGGAIIIMTDQDPKTPLDMSAITEDRPLKFKAVDMWELYNDKQNFEDLKNVQIIDDEGEEEYFNYYAQLIHKSRVMVMPGIVAPSFVRPRLRGWGTSEVEVLIRSLNQYIKANNLIFAVLDEFKLDIYRLKNLANTLMSPQGDAAVQKRVSMANKQKNFQNAIVLDAEDEYQNKELSFAGISETLTGIKQHVASDMRMPMSKIFGIASAGFSSGEDDIENYNAMVESEVRAKSKYEIIRMVELRCQRKFGFVPDDLKISFKPLRVLSSADEESVKTSKYARLESAVTKGLMTIEEFKKACNKENLLVVQIDTSLDVIQMALPEGGSGSEIDATPKAKKSVTAAKEAKS